VQAELKACQELEARKAMHDATFKQRQCAPLPCSAPIRASQRGGEAEPPPDLHKGGRPTQH
jgi:hypothetical protein